MKSLFELGFACEEFGRGAFGALGVWVSVKLGGGRKGCMASFGGIDPGFFFS